MYCQMCRSSSCVHTQDYIRHGQDSQSFESFTCTLPLSRGGPGIEDKDKTMNNGEVNELVKRVEKSAYLLGIAIGGITGILNNLQNSTPQNAQAESNLLDLKDYLTKSVDEIFYKDSV